MKTFAVTLKVRNNLLVERREKLGFSAPQIAKYIGIPYYAYLSIETLRISPYKKDGSWRPNSVKIAAFYNILPEDLFPESVCGVVKPVADIKVSESDMRMLGGGMSAFSELSADLNNAVDQAEIRSVIHKALRCLCPRDENVLRDYFGIGDQDAHTHKEMGIERGFSRGRTQQITKNALLRLQSNPSLMVYMGISPNPEES